MAEEYTQININVEVCDAEAVDKMAKEEGTNNRSAFIRKLIRQEIARRYSQPNPLVTVEQAQAVEGK